MFLTYMKHIKVNFAIYFSKFDEKIYDRNIPKFFVFHTLGLSCGFRNEKHITFIIVCFFCERTESMFCLSIATQIKKSLLYLGGS